MQPSSDDPTSNAAATNGGTNLRDALSTAPAELVLTNPVPASDEPQSVGELLRHAREHAGFSVADLAARLRMGAKQVDALEQADYTLLPQGTFLRGFVRNYAKAVGISPDDALAVLERTHSSGAAVLATTVVTPKAAESRVKVEVADGLLTNPALKLLTYAGIALLLVGAIWYWWEYIRPHRAEGGRAKTADVSIPIATNSAASLEGAPRTTAPTGFAGVETIPAAPGSDGALAVSPSTTPATAAPTTTPSTAPTASTATVASPSLTPSVAPAAPSAPPVTPAPDSAAPEQKKASRNR